ncbi:alpha/beta hydrolase [Caulobacter sp. KR2-114]|uniref:alpha/beta hydrolase n=1 Tax=Caulobacter sp. KR2-114 TaxID=3400912 RepID=UPI003BFCA571
MGDPRFVGLTSRGAPRAGAGGHPCQGLYWTGDQPRPAVAVIASHYNVDFAEHYIAPYFAERGFGFLGWNTRYRGAEDLFMLDQALADIGAGVRWLREVAGARTVVLLGNSGGGSLMAAYQAASLGDDALPGGDLYISLNAHPGRPEVLTAWLDPSVTDETDPLATDPALDAFDPRNGPPYAPDFIARYRAAQVARNHRISAWARAELARLNAAGVPDRIFPLFRTWADLRFMDPAIDPSERPCPACYAGPPARANRQPVGLGRSNTLKTWLSMWSLEASACRGAEQLAKLQLPALVVQSLADTGVFPSDAQAVFEAVAAADKTLKLVPGAHYFEDAPDRRAAVADLMAGWIRERL